jgi:hypothetical protein
MAYREYFESARQRGRDEVYVALRFTDLFFSLAKRRHFPLSSQYPRQGGVSNGNPWFADYFHGIGGQQKA